MAVEVTRRRFTADEYQTMGRAGILREGDRVELIDGEVLAMSPIGPPHSGTVSRLTHLFVRLVGEAAIVRIQLPIRVDRYSEPQPDLTLLRPRADFYASAHPTAADALLVIEVAQASANYDRSVKAGLYARANVGEYWLVDLNAAAVTRYLDPARGGYRVESTLQPGQQWAPALLPHCLVTTRDIFG